MPKKNPYNEYNTNRSVRESKRRQKDYFSGSVTKKGDENFPAMFNQFDDWQVERFDYPFPNYEDTDWKQNGNVFAGRIGQRNAEYSFDSNRGTGQFRISGRDDDKFGSWQLIDATSQFDARRAARGAVAEQDRQDWLSSMRSRIENSTLPIVRAEGVTFFDAWKDNKHLSMEDLGGMGFSFRQDDPQTGKRISRVLQGSDFNGIFNRDEFPVAEFGPGAVGMRNNTDEFDSQWDGANLISRSMLGRMTSGMSRTAQEQLMNNGRFSGTLMMNNMQYKGHWFVRDDEQMPGGSMLAVPRGSGKKQFGYEPNPSSPGSSFYFGLDNPVKPHNYVRSDSQTLINHYHELFGNEQLTGWLDESIQGTLNSIESGRAEEGQINRLFSDVYDEESLNKRAADPLYKYLMSGGKLSESPYMTRKFADQYAQSIYNRQENKLGLPIQGGARMYLASASVSANEQVQNLQSGQTFADWQAGTIYVNSADWKNVAKRLGGADQDDAANIILGKDNKAFITRNPNMQGEYALMDLVNPQALTRRGVKPVDVDWSKLSGITQIEDKTPGELSKGSVPEYAKGDYRKYSNYLMTELSKTPGLLGRYINALSARTLIEGKEPTNVPAAGEDIIDALQKNLGTNVSPIVDFINNTREEYRGSTMPAEAARRLNLLHGENRGDFRPDNDHWMTNLKGEIHKRLESFLEKTEGFANQAGPSVEALSHATGQKLGYKLSDVYYGALSDKSATLEPGEDSNYGYAARVTKAYLGNLSEEDRRQSILQAYTRPVTRYDNVNDRFLWQTSKDPRGDIASDTFDALRHYGVLGDFGFEGDSDIGVSYRSSMESTPTKSMIVSGFWSNMVERIGGNVEDVRRKVASQIDTLKGAEISVRRKDDRVEVYNKASGRPFGLVALNQKSQFDDLESATIAGVTTTDVSLTGTKEDYQRRLLDKKYKNSIYFHLTDVVKKEGHEDLSIDVKTGSGDTVPVSSGVFSGPDWAEPSAITEMEAKKLAIETGGSISGTKHTQSVGTTVSKEDLSLSDVGNKRVRARSEFLWSGESGGSEFNTRPYSGFVNRQNSQQASAQNDIPENVPEGDPNWHMQEPPDYSDPEFFDNESAPYRLRHTTEVGSRIQNAIKNRESFVAKEPPGWGKTDLIRGAVEAKGRVTLVAEPFTALGTSMRDDLKRSGYNAIYLHGYPGKGASEEEMGAYTKSRQDFIDSFYSSTNLNTETGSREWKPGAQPLVGVMSFQKASRFGESSIWNNMLKGNQGLVDSFVVDEVHKTIGATDRASKDLLSNISGYYGGSKVALSGTLPSHNLKNIAASINAPEGNVESNPTTMAHINFMAASVDKSNAVSEMSKMALANDDALTYASTTGQVHAISEQLRATGLVGVDEYHKGTGGGSGYRPPEDLDRIQGMLNRGELDPNRRYVMSSAASHGINLPTKHVNYMGVPLSDLSEVTQIASRIRQDNENPEKNVGDFYWQANEGDFKWAANSARTQIPKLTPKALGEAFNYARNQTDYDPNWKNAGQQIGEQMGKVLEGKYGVSHHLGSVAKDMAEEMGLISLKGDDWMFSQESNPEETFAAGQYSDPFGSGDKSGRQRMGLGTYLGQLASHRARQYDAMGDVWSGAMSTGNAKAAGGIIKGALNAYNERGVEGLEQFKNIDMPKQVWDKFRDKIEKATESLSLLGDSKEDLAKLKQSVSETISQMPQSAAKVGGDYMMQAAVGGGGAAAAQMGNALYSRATEMSFDGEDNRRGGGGGYGGGGRMSGGDQARRLLYGAYMAKRIWQYTAAESFQDAAYAAEPGYGLLTNSAESSLPAGVAGFDALGREGSGRAVIQNFGGLMDAGSMAMMNPHVADFASNMRVAAGLGFGGLEMGMNMSQSGYFMSQDKNFAAQGRMLSGVGNALTTGGAILGIGTAAVGGAMSIFNAANGLEGREAASFGNWGRNAVAGFGVSQAMQYATEDKSLYEKWTSGQLKDEVSLGLASSPLVGDLFGGYGTIAEIKDKYGVTNEAVSKTAVGKTGVAYAQYDNAWDKMKSYKGTIDDLILQYGGKSSDYLGLMTELGRGSDVTSSQMGKMLSSAQGMGYSPTQYGSMFQNYAQQMGINSWTPQYGQAMAQWSSYTTPQQISQAQNYASRVSMFSSQVSPYMSSDSAAAQITDKYGMADPTSMAAYRSMVDVYSQFGDINQVIGFQEGGSQAAGIQSAFGVGPSTGTAVGSIFDLAASSSSSSGVYAQKVTAAERIAQFQQAAGGGKFGDWRASSIFQTLGQPMMEGGMSPQETVAALTEFAPKVSEFSMSQMNLWSSIIGGDMRAASFASYKSPQVLAQTQYADNPWAARSYDVGGNPIYQTSGTDFTQWLGANSQMGYMSTQQFGYMNPQNYMGMGLGSVVENAMATGYAKQYATNLGVTDEGMKSAFAENGMTGVSAYASQRSYELSLASIGIAGAQNALQMNYYWGQESGGTWDKPAAGSMWNLEDQLKNLQHQQTLYGFESQRERMALTESFAVQQEGLSWERMETNWSYQKSQQDDTRQSMIQNRQWAREDWEFQDRSSSMTNAWAMEDINEAIRFSGGRQRKQLMKQKDRLTTQQGMEREQTETERDRQEQTWAREEERFRKQTEYAEKLIRLDTKQFDMSKDQREKMHDLEQKDFDQRVKDYEEEKKIRDEMTEVSRKYQHDQLLLQQASIGIQYEQLKLQREQELLAKGTDKDWQNSRYEMEQVSKYLGTSTTALVTLAKAISSVNTTPIQQMIGGINNVSVSKVNAITNLLRNLD